MSSDNCCSICLEEITQEKEFQKWECQHRFHQSCVNKWNKGCPICRTSILATDTETIDITWSISRNPRNVLDIERMKNMNNIRLSDDLIPMYKDVWKDRDCIDQNHNLWFFKPFAIICICENCNTVQSFNQIH